MYGISQAVISGIMIGYMLVTLLAGIIAGM